MSWPIANPRDVAYMEFEALFGEEYAGQLDEAGWLSDDVTNFEGLRWSVMEDRAVVFLPGLDKFVVVDKLEEVAYDEAACQYAVYHEGCYYKVPVAIAWGLVRLRELRDEGYRSTPCTRVRARLPSPPPPPPAEAYPIDMRSAVGAFLWDRHRFDADLALYKAARRLLLDRDLNFRRFRWTPEATMVLALPGLDDDDVLVEIMDIDDVDVDEDEGMTIHVRSVDDWFDVPWDTEEALEYLLELRDTKVESERAASPADDAEPTQPPPTSPGRAGTDFRSTSPTAATSINDYFDTASAAAGASTILADEQMADNDALDAQNEAPRAVDEGMHDDSWMYENMDVDEPDVDDLKWM